MTRLTFLSPVGVVGGAERVLIAAARQVRRLRPDWPASAVLFAGGPLVPQLESLGVRVGIVPLPAGLAGVGDSQLRGSGRAGKLARLAGRAVAAGPGGVEFARRLRQVVRELRPQVLHANGVKAYLGAAVATAGYQPPPAPRVVWHVHDFLSHRPLVGRVLRRVRPRPACAVAISPAVARDAAGVLPGLPIHTVMNAVDTDHFAPGGPAADLDRLAGLPPDPAAVRVGLVATYANWKGHASFLAAVARVPNVRGYVVGGPIYATAGSEVTRAELESLTDSFGIRGRIGFVPFQPDPAGVYRALDVVAHASTRAEPFGLTVAEAMACGRAVVVSAAGGAAELFADGGEALGHAPGDVDGLAAAIRRLADDPELRRRLGAAARAAAVGRFAEGRFGRELVAVYEQVGGG